MKEAKSWTAIAMAASLSNIIYNRERERKKGNTSPQAVPMLTPGPPGSGPQHLGKRGEAGVGIPSLLAGTLPCSLHPGIALEGAHCPRWTRGHVGMWPQPAPRDPG